MTLAELDAAISELFIVSDGPSGPHSDKGNPYVSYVYGGGSESELIDALWRDLSGSPGANLQWRERPKIDGGILRARACISSARSIP